MLRRYIGDRAFYRKTLTIALPIILQSFISNFVSMLDNLMVGQLSTAQISGVTIINNNLLLIFTLCLFGGAGGAGIFTAQFFGARDHDGIRHTMRFKLITCLALLVVFGAVFYFLPDPLIRLYLQGEGDAELAASTLLYARQYLHMMLPGLLPLALTYVYAGTLRECGQPTVPMLASGVAAGINLVLNYLLIYGKLGLPAMGIRGAALATVISRYAEFGIILLWTQAHTGLLPFIRGLYSSLYIPAALTRSILKVALPLLLNDALYSFGVAFLNQCYSTCGLDVVPALSISSTIYSISAVAFRSLGNAVGIFMGQLIGSGADEPRLRAHFRQLTALTIVTGTLFAITMACLSGVFPQLYNTSSQIRRLSAALILINAAVMPLQAYAYPVFFTIRAGGKTAVAAIFDCGAVWVLNLPLAFILSHFTAASITVIYALVNATDIIKCILGYFLIKGRFWMQNLSHNS